MNVDTAQFEALAKEILRRCIADETSEEIYQWLSDRLAKMGGGDDGALLTWEKSFDLVDQLLAEYEQVANTPPDQLRRLDWPWKSWNKLIDPLEDGMLGVITAPDGAGKTIYAETIAEHWAAHKNRVVFVHYELNRKLMMLRRTSRHANIPSRVLKAGKLDASQKQVIADIRPRLLAWEGFISYLHTPGWSMERTVEELRKQVAEQQCDVVVLDYLEKVAVSRRQLNIYGTNTYQREADNVEQLKTFSEQTGVPVVMIAQMNKAGKSGSFDRADRTDMRGAGEKSEKANLVVLLHRDRTEEGYSNTVRVLVDKNTMGATGQFNQVMQPEFYRVGDIHAGQFGSTSLARDQAPAYWEDR